MPEVLEAVEHEKSAMRAVTRTRTRSSRTDLSKWSDRFLILACQKLGFPAAHIFQSIGKIPYQTQIAIRKELEDLKYIAFDEWRIESSTRLFYEVLAAGYELSEQPPQHLQGRGHIPHRNGQLWVQTQGFRLGYRHSVTEFKVPGTSHTVDNAFYQDDFQNLHLSEVVHACWDNLPKNIKITFTSDLPIEKLTIITAQKAIAQKIRKLLAADIDLKPFHDRIAFELITPYMNAFVQGA